MSFSVFGRVDLGLGFFDTIQQRGVALLIFKYSHRQVNFVRIGVCIVKLSDPHDWVRVLCPSIQTCVSPRASKLCCGLRLIAEGKSKRRGTTCNFYSGGSNPLK